MTRTTKPTKPADPVEITEIATDPQNIAAEGDTLPGASAPADDSDLPNDAPADGAQAADLSDVDQHPALDVANPDAPDPDGSPAASDGPTDTTADPGADADAAAAEVEAEAQAAADAAAAEVEAEAKAAADAAAAAKPAKPRARTKRAPKLDHEKLAYLQGAITQLNVTGHRLGLVDELTDLHGMAIDRDHDADTWAINMAGIATDPADSIETALTNWGNAARRAMAEVAT